MEHWKNRSELLLGPAAMARLARARVAVFGLGGVGGHAAEALARGGVGHLELFDKDVVDATNLNRQLAATVADIGRPKAQVMAARCRAVAPGVEAVPRELFYLPDTAAEAPLDGFDYIVDAVDTVAAKLELVCRAKAAGVPIVCAMGCGNRLDATAFQVTDLFATEGDPLARVLRKELRRRGVTSLKVVCSTAPVCPTRSDVPGEETAPGRRAPGSVSWVPGVAGMILAGEVIKDLAGI